MRMKPTHAADLIDRRSYCADCPDPLFGFTDRQKFSFVVRFGILLTGQMGTSAAVFLGTAQRLVGAADDGFGGRRFI